MGYFANGTEGELYEEQYCRRCVHFGDEDGMGCPVWAAHLLHSYAECNNEDSILHMLIPRDEAGYNQQCNMFLLAESKEVG